MFPSSTRLDSHNTYVHICIHTAVQVEDIHKHPNHITCDPNSKSEIVVPVFADPKTKSHLVGVLDMDSPVRCFNVLGFVLIFVWPLHRNAKKCHAPMQSRMYTGLSVQFRRAFSSINLYLQYAPNWFVTWYITKVVKGFSAVDQLYLEKLVDKFANACSWPHITLSAKPTSDSKQKPSSKNHCDSFSSFSSSPHAVRLTEEQIKFLWPSNPDAHLFCPMSSLR